ncbi:hypothetical protein AOX59_06625 [Lentibacillus amyloliquefaciens]|uniref:Uncharacterized protein n=1 Tax=Lentibacillus amyloliquefaciens TaxID=1472767 RepID=A0A0U4F418_9BACI|nr:hypothetical protein AOX59_06625 [Lentibacillus amyloliquefaciens]
MAAISFYIMFKFYFYKKFQMLVFQIHGLIYWIELIQFKAIGRKNGCEIFLAQMKCGHTISVKVRQFLIFY